MALFTASIDMEIRKVCKLQTLNMGEERKCAEGSPPSVESEIELNIWHSWLFSPPWSRYRLGSPLLRPSPGSPLVSGVDNPVGDTGQTVDSHRYFAFNWRLTSTYIPDQVLFSFGRWVWLMWVSPAHTFSHTPAPHQLTWCTLIVSISRLPTRSSLISRPLALSSQLNNLKRINCDHLPARLCRFISFCNKPENDLEDCSLRWDGCWSSQIWKNVKIPLHITVKCPQLWCMEL